MIKKALIVCALMVSAVCLLPEEALSQTTNLLTLAEAQKIADAAEARARQDNWNVVIAILDNGGHLIAFRRMDGTQVGSVDVAIKKAETAVKFNRATKVFEDGVKAGNLNILTLGVTAAEGGVPIMRDGKIVGSIGVSGVTSAQDGIIAAAGVEAFK